MSEARTLAEKGELEAVVAFLGQRLFQRAGDVAELKIALQAAQAEIAELKKAGVPTAVETSDAAGS